MDIFEAVRNGYIQRIQELLNEGVNINSQDYQEASPLHRIHKDAPPFLIIQGDADTLVCAPEAAYFAARLKDTSKESVCYVELEGAQHAFDIFVSLRSEHCKHAVQKYLSYLHDQYLSKKQ